MALKYEEEDHSDLQSWCGTVMIEHALREPPVKRTILVDCGQLAKTLVDFFIGNVPRSRLKPTTTDEKSSQELKEDKRREK